MSVTPEIEADIMRAHRANPSRFSPFKVAKQVGATVGEVIATVNRNRTSDQIEVSAVVRAEREPYIGASRRASDPGSNTADGGVVRARQAFEAGTHDMATHRDGGWLHLCSFLLARPRKPRPGYFTGKAI